MICPGPSVRATALSQSTPTPTTKELARVVVSVAVGAPDAALALPIVPIAPEPLVPVVSTPVNDITVIELETFCEMAAATVTPVSVVGAKARQISAVPRCALVRPTRAQVRPPPVTLVTVVAAACALSAATSASSSSFGAAVEKAGDVTLVPGPRSVHTATSIAGPTDDPVKFALALPFVTVTVLLAGLNAAPGLVGVIV